MSEYTLDYMTQNFAVGNKLDNGDAWWHQVIAQTRPDLMAGLRVFDYGIPDEVIMEMIGFDPVQVPMEYTDPATGDRHTYGSIDDDGAHSGPKVVLNSRTRAPLGSNDGASNLFNYREWFVNGPKRLLDTPELNVGFLALFKDGAQAAMQIDLAKTIVDAYTNIAFRPFLFAASSLNGSMRPHMGTGFQLMVCDNTFRMGQREAQNSGHLYSLKQTRNARPDWNDARRVLDILHINADTLTAEFKELCDTEVNARDFGKFIEAYVPLPERDATSRTGGRSYTMATNKREALTSLYHTDSRVAPWTGTAFGVSQAVTTWSQHMQTVRGALRLERNRMNAINGDSMQVHESAMAVLSGVLDLGRPLVGAAA